MRWRVGSVQAGPLRRPNPAAPCWLVGGARRRRRNPILDRVQRRAHWGSWVLFDDAGVAREHVRVARGFAGGGCRGLLGCSGRPGCRIRKVRVTRVVDAVDETPVGRVGVDRDRLPAGPDDFRLPVRRWAGRPQQTKRRVSWHEREDGMITSWPGYPRRKPPCCWRRFRRRRISSARHQPNPDPCGAAEQQAAPGVGVYSNADARCWMWRGCSWRRHRRIGPVRTAPPGGGARVGGEPGWRCSACSCERRRRLRRSSS